MNMKKRLRGRTIKTLSFDKVQFDDGLAGQRAEIQSRFALTRFNRIFYVVVAAFFLFALYRA
jgi:hypothetical protein